ncbi:MAG: RagB/SusD family nutrient uptake outer membrane protein [Prevotella sp.]|nr:RagB/SusD family nutrient uptake outer membrane protein [Prevotella sp.]
MKKNNIFKSLTVCALSMLLLASCEDFTELEPKGMNLLSNTDQLEMLLNQEMYFQNTDMGEMAGDMVTAYSSISATLNQPSKTRDAIIWSYDESAMDKMAELTASDGDYADFYGVIGTVCNPVLQRINDATGDESKKVQLKCEALVLRALFHYILVNKFAAAYNPSTAANTRGIIVLTEDIDISVPQEQKTVEEVYEQILKDIDECIELNGLPAVAINRMRMSKPCPYALRALVCASMQKWDEAEAAAKQALSIDQTMCNFNSSEYQTQISGFFLGGSYDALYRPKCEFPEDYFYTHSLELFNSYPPETQSAVEEGNAMITKIGNLNMAYDYLMDAASSMIGEMGYILTYDMNSGWNRVGLRVPQMYLIIAEAEIHKNNIGAAMEALDVIRENRIDPAIYQPLQGNVTSQADAIAHLKQTALGENLYSYYSFIDKKRWNEVSGWEQTVTRTLSGRTYTLKPGSKLWIFPIPQNAMNNNPNLIQNYKD